MSFINLTHYLFKLIDFDPGSGIRGVCENYESEFI